MATWADFYPELMPHVVGCPNPLANIALREASRSFFKRTRAWQEWLESQTVLAGEREYDLDVPFGSMVVRIERCTVDGAPLDVLSYVAMGSDFTQREQTAAGVVSRDRMTLTLTRNLPAGSQIAAAVTLMPSKSSYGIPDHLFAQHSQDIVEGAKQRLMLTGGTPFYNEALAAAAFSTFEQAVATKAFEAYKGETASIPRRRVGWC